MTTDRRAEQTDSEAVGGHTFEREVIEGGPVLACVVCNLIWWPDQRTPKQTCRQRQAAEDRRKR